MKSPITNWHALLILAVLVIVPVVGHFLGLSNELTGYITTAAGLLATASGFLSTADAQRVEDIASNVSPQITTAVQTAKDALTELHNTNAANVAAVHTAVAVQASKSGFLLPAPLKVVEPVVTQAVEDSIQNKPVTL